MRVISGKARGTVLHSIEDINTRPTLDRVKESLFNILQMEIEEKVILDLFAGSGQIAIEFLSRGAKMAYLCDTSKDAVNMINQNLAKTKLTNKTLVYNEDYIEVLKKLESQNKKIDIIFIDPPYKKDLAVNAVEEILKRNLLANSGKIIIETDEPKRDIDELEKIGIKEKIYDIRKYGRASLIFIQNA